MPEGLAVVLGMTLAYAVSLLGLVLAYLAYRKRHRSGDDRS